MKLKTLLTSLIFVGLAIVLPVYYPARAVASGPPLLITEVQTGSFDQSGNEDPLDEFVEVTNTLPTAVDLDGPVWLEYLSAANDGSGPPTSKIAYLIGHIEPGRPLLLAHAGYYLNQASIMFGQTSTSDSGLLAKSGGHLRVMLAGSMVDCVSWGSAVPIDGCSKISGLPAPGSSLQRLRSSDGSYDYGRSLSYTAPITPGQPNAMLPPDSPSETAQAGSCPPSVGISELLANPAGTDSGHEYIELYNSSDQSASLLGCELQVGSKSYKFSADEQLGGKQFKSYYDSQTGLGLTNGGGSVSLSDVGRSRVVKTDYPALDDDQAWALIGEQWQVTDRPTPDQPNLALSDSLAKDLVSGTKLVNLAACPAGKYRNPATGRCKQLPVATTAKACTAGQERNPSTGRCRKIAVAKTIKPCAANQQRNPATGRCRKVEATKKITDTHLDQPTSQPEYKIMGVVGVLIVAYAGYEYRRDLAGWWQRLRQRVKGDQLMG